MKVRELCSTFIGDPVTLLQLAGDHIVAIGNASGGLTVVSFHPHHVNNIIGKVVDKASTAPSSNHVVEVSGSGKEGSSSTATVTAPVAAENSSKGKREEAEDSTEGVAGKEEEEEEEEENKAGSSNKIETADTKHTSVSSVRGATTAYGDLPTVTEERGREIQMNRKSKIIRLLPYAYEAVKGKRHTLCT